VPERIAIEITTVCIESLSARAIHTLQDEEVLALAKLFFYFIIKVVHPSRYFAYLPAVDIHIGLESTSFMDAMLIE